MNLQPKTINIIVFFIFLINLTKAQSSQPENIIECTSYVLPTINPDSRYYTETNKGGTQLFANDEITTTQTIYVYTESGSGPSAVTSETSFDVYIVETPTATISTSINTICEGSNNVFDILGTPNSEVTYNLGNENLTTTLNTSGNGTIILTGATSPSETINLISITSPSTILGNVKSAIGGRKPENTIGAPLPAGSLLNISNSADLLNTTPTITLTLADIVPAGTNLTLYLAKSNNNANATITDGVASQIFNTGTLKLSQAVAFKTAVATNTITITRNSGVTLINGIEYTIPVPNCTSPLTSSETINVNPLPVPDVVTDITTCDNYTLPTLTNGNKYYTESGGPTGSGINLSPGDLITNTQTVYIYKETSINSYLCYQENSFDITFANKPTVFNLSSNGYICSGSDAEFTINASPGATITYTTTSGGTQTIDINSSGIAVITLPNVTANENIVLNEISNETCTVALNNKSIVIVMPIANAVAITKTSSISGNVISATGGQRTSNAIGEVLPSGSTLNSSNAAIVTLANPVITVTLADIIPAGRNIKLYLAGNDAKSNITISDGVSNQNFRNGPLSLSQEVVFTMGQDSNTITITRNSGNTWIDGIAYTIPIPSTEQESVCEGDSIIFGIIGTPNSEVTYNLGGDDLTTTLDEAGSATITITETDTVSETINLISLTPPNSISGNVLSANGGRDSFKAIGSVLPEGSTLNNSNSATLLNTDPTITLTLADIVPAGTILTLYLAKSNIVANATITDGVVSKIFNFGDLEISQAVPFQTATATDKITITRNSGVTLVNGIEYTVKVPSCSKNITDSKTINITPSVFPDVLSDITECNSYTLPELYEGYKYYTETGGTGLALFPGDIITSTQKIYVFAGTTGDDNENCSSESNFMVTIDNITCPLVYPNPVNNTLNVILKESLNSTDVDLFNANGKFLMNKKVDSSEMKIDMQNLEDGIYYLVIRSKYKSILRRIIKN